MRQLKHQKWNGHFVFLGVFVVVVVVALHQFSDAQKLHAKLLQQLRLLRCL